METVVRAQNRIRSGISTVVTRSRAKRRKRGSEREGGWEERREARHRGEGVGVDGEERKVEMECVRERREPSAWHGAKATGSSFGSAAQVIILTSGLVWA
jgi:hypothetical protein